ncbi:Nitroreductase [Flaviramulus basaltis]|uniref:Nitroreductase n=1 Tax=Flaviramulus basaltis TaxID=369401 RepID=A0A1K2IIW9_9FLAO|nr:nitroreductase family protein [Flaviramulus basaltis]SFZ92343.1 Nitroreductase [Flaviramulus basaltis]
MNQGEQIRLENIADTETEIFALLKQRYSPRIFKKKKIEKGHLKQLFEAIRWSASSNNIQPWRFIYAEKDTDAYKSIFNCLSDFNKKWANNAPLLMLTAYKENTDDGKQNFHALHDLGLCLGSMTVQAQYMGIGLHHMAGVDWKGAQNVFEVPDGFHVTTAIAVGYYGGILDDLSKDLQEQETAKRERMPYEHFAYKEVWNKENKKL